MVLKSRKINLLFYDFVLFTAVYAISLLFGTSDSLRMPDFISPRLIVVFFCFTAVVTFGFRILFKVYRSIWRYASAKTYIRLVLSDLCGFIVVFGARFVIRPLNMGFGVTAMIFALNCLAAMSMRFMYQILYARLNAADKTTDDREHLIKIAIIGAGNIGASLADELRRNPQAHYKPICFVDVDRKKTGQSLNGLPILYEDENIVETIKRMPVQEIVIAMPDTDGEKRQRLYDLYIQTGCKVKIYGYPLGNNENGDRRRSLRELSIEDLLSRDSIKLNNVHSAEFYKDKTVLITGGGGSIGSELCRQIAKLSPKKIVIFDIYENGAYDIQQELVRKYGDRLSLEVIIGSVRDEKRLDAVFAAIHPDVVLHAAAHKHVPLMEKSCTEAIKNNVLGTYNTANAAEKYGVEKFVLISTDKAVNPTNVMGASKRMCEMIIQCRSDSRTKFVAVRFGNVLGSNGSVIPLFRRQIEEGGPITVTDRRIIRYFMTIPEAAQLVLEAGAMAKRGELFVLDMGKPVKIYDLAVNMIKLSGLVPNEDIKIEEIGLRPGEKLYEELLIESETLSKTENDLIFVEHDTPCTRSEVDEKIRLLTDAAVNGTSDNVRAALKATVPTFMDADAVNGTALKEKIV
jgi:FlaA1/EpsC-like NDP-sugar epimerase